MHDTQHLDIDLVGMTVSLPRLDVEAAAGEIAAAGYGSIEVFSGQVGPGVFDVPAEESHARAAGVYLQRQGFVPVMLNSIDGRFDPLRRPESSIDALAAQLRLAHALGMPRILIWDGIFEPDADVSLKDAPQHLAGSIVAARAASGLESVPAVSVELHPFTFALAHDLLEETAAALVSVGAGVCLDVAHFAVARGASFADELSPVLLDAINHVHWCDSDLATEGLHFPPGRGIVDLAAVERVLAGRSVILALDLFGWPAPREVMREYSREYKELVQRHRSTLGTAA